MIGAFSSNTGIDGVYSIPQKTNVIGWAKTYRPTASGNDKANVKLRDLIIIVLNPIKSPLLQRYEQRGSITTPIEEIKVKAIWDIFVPAIKYPTYLSLERKPNIIGFNCT